MVKFIWVGLFVGTFIGQIIPALWGGSTFSISASFFSLIFGALGLWIGFKADRSLQ